MKIKHNEVPYCIALSHRDGNGMSFFSSMIDESASSEWEQLLNSFGIGWPCSSVGRAVGSKSREQGEGASSSLARKIRLQKGIRANAFAAWVEVDFLPRPVVEELHELFDLWNGSKRSSECAVLNLTHWVRTNASVGNKWLQSRATGCEVTLLYLIMKLYLVLNLNFI